MRVDVRVHVRVDVRVDVRVGVAFHIYVSVGVLRRRTPVAPLVPTDLRSQIESAPTVSACAGGSECRPEVIPAGCGWIR